MPRPDLTAEPDGFVVEVSPGDRIHFLDWGGPPRTTSTLLVHGLSNTAWSWAPVARRLRTWCRVVAMDLRGHGLSDAPIGGYDANTLADDAVAVAEGSGLLAQADDRVVLAGHGFGAIVAAWTAAALATRCAGVVLVDGGWESLEVASGVDVDEFLRGLDEPPEVMASIGAFLADRRAFDPDSWDDDQERAVRAAVVETHAGHVVPATRPHVIEACVRAMFRYEPVTVLAAVPTPVTAIVAVDDARGTRSASLARASEARVAEGRDPIRVVPLSATGHNLMRYRPDDVVAAIAAATAPLATPNR